MSTPLIVEDGSIVAGADSYLSVADANVYFANRNNSTWADADKIDKEAALRKATDYLVQAYRLSWQGWKVLQTQSLDWPRYSVYVDGTGITSHLIPSNTVPDEVRKACAELALRALSADLFADQTQAVKSEQVDKIKIDYSEFSPQSVRYKSIDAMLAPFLISTSNGISRDLRR